MSMTFFPEPDSPCLRCFIDYDAEPSGEDTSTAGVLSMIPASVSSLQCIDVLKILTGHKDKVRQTMIFIDPWTNDFTEIPVKQLSDCPCCKEHKYQFYKGL